MMDEMNLPQCFPSEDQGTKVYYSSLGKKKKKKKKRELRVKTDNILCTKQNYTEVYKEGISKKKN